MHLRDLFLFALLVLILPTNLSVADDGTDFLSAVHYDGYHYHVDQQTNEAVASFMTELEEVFADIGSEDGSIAASLVKNERAFAEAKRVAASLYKIKDRAPGHWLGTGYQLFKQVASAFGFGAFKRNDDSMHMTGSTSVDHDDSAWDWVHADPNYMVVESEDGRQLKLKRQSYVVSVDLVKIMAASQSPEELLTWMQATIAHRHAHALVLNRLIAAFLSNQPLVRALAYDHGDEFREENRGKDLTNFTKACLRRAQRADARILTEFLLLMWVRDQLSHHGLPQSHAGVTIEEVPEIVDDESVTLYPPNLEHILDLARKHATLFVLPHGPTLETLGDLSREQRVEILNEGVALIKQHAPTFDQKAIADELAGFVVAKTRLLDFN